MRTGKSQFFKELNALLTSIGADRDQIKKILSDYGAIGWISGGVWSNWFKHDSSLSLQMITDEATGGVKDESNCKLWDKILFGAEIGYHCLKNWVSFGNYSNIISFIHSQAIVALSRVTQGYYNNDKKLKNQ